MGISNLQELVLLFRIPELPDSSKLSVLDAEKASPPRLKPRLQSVKVTISSLRFTLQAYLCAACLVVTINLAWIAYAKVNYGVIHGAGAGFGEIYYGDCSHATKLDTYLHFLINFLSTLLLSGSSTFLATYSSPTRKEVDKAHRAGKWVHVGVYSLRNILHISKRKVFVCTLLVITTIPFNLIYNSLIFTSTSATEYRWAVVTPDFLQNGAFALKSTALQSEYQEIQREVGTYARLDNATCIGAYFNQLVSSRRNVVLVTSNHSDSGTVLKYGYASLTPNPSHVSDWMCHKSPCNLSPDLQHLNWFNISDFRISYCLSENIQPECSVRFSWNIMITVVVCSFAKLMLISFILFQVKDAELLVTPGDAAASFLKVEDPCTEKMCMTTSLSTEPMQPGKTIDPYQVAKYRGARYFAAIGRLQWFAYSTTMFVGLMYTISLLGAALSKLNAEATSMRQLGFGQLSALALVFQSSFVTNIASATMIANAPQLALSIVYLVYQNVMTSMFLARDWNYFGCRDQSLMVSSPVGEQRGAWFFGVPLFAGIFLQSFQFIFHWVVSQAIFPVRIKLFDADGNAYPPGAALHNCGFSAIAMCVTIVCGVVLTLTAAGMGTCKVKPDGGPPVASTNSAAISAACHYYPEELEDLEAMVQSKLRWGVVGEWPNGVGHCNLAPARLWHEGKISKPVKGAVYA